MKDDDMKIYTSYFYQVRFFQKNMIPLSTAVWDPAWFHDNKGQRYIFKDKRGIYNGLRAEPFVPGECCDNLCRGPERCLILDSNSCEFLKKYREQLDSYNFKEILERFNRLSNKIAQRDNLKTDIIFALIFHEAPSNSCSERWVVQEWFKDNGMEITELNPKEGVKDVVQKPDIW